MRRLKDLITGGKVVIFSDREAKTLAKIAMLFDLDHDDGAKFRRLRELINLCQTLSTFGALGHLLISVLIALLAAFAAFASSTNRWPWLDPTNHPK